MAAGTPTGRRHLVVLKEIAGPASLWSWARTTEGEQRLAMDTTEFTVVRQERRVVGAPVGTEQF